MSLSDTALPHARHMLSTAVARAYEHAPQPLVAAYQSTAPLRQVYADRRIPVTLQHGLSKDGRRASLLVAGAGPSIAYMLGRFFSQPLHSETVGHIRLTALMRTLRRLRASADMTIAQLPRLLSGWLGGDEYLHVPPWVGTRLLVPEHPEQFARQTGLWHDLSPARRNGLRPRVSHETADFDRFYHEMYLPYATRRFGDHAALRPQRQLRRLLHRGGALMWIYQAEEQIAGALLRQHAGCLDLLSLGLAGTGDGGRRAGAIPAIYYFCLEHARSQGCILIDAGNSRPSPADGVTWFKRKWNVRLTPPRTNVATDLLFRWERPNHAVRTFLSHTPLIIQQGRELSLVAALDDGNVARAYQSLWMEGLQRLYVYGDETGVGCMPGLTLAESPPIA